MTPDGRTIELYRRPPKAVAFMARALTPSRGWAGEGDLPALVVRWQGLRIPEVHLARLRAMTGGRDEEGVTVLYPHVLGFRLQMVLLTHPRYPLPIWGALQIRNSLQLHRRLKLDRTYELETATETSRVADKGLEVDIRSTMTDDVGECAWESVITYFYRSHIGVASDTRAAAPPDLSCATVVSPFAMPNDGGLRFGKLTGDYNGIHWANWYARRFGFASAFLHPQRVAGLCLSRLAGPNGESQLLELWIKGPVPYGSRVEVKSLGQADDLQFGVSISGELRIAVAGRWRATSRPLKPRESNERGSESGRSNG